MSSSLYLNESYLFIELQRNSLHISIAWIHYYTEIQIPLKTVGKERKMKVSTAFAFHLSIHHYFGISIRQERCMMLIIFKKHHLHACTQKYYS